MSNDKTSTVAEKPFKTPLLSAETYFSPERYDINVLKKRIEQDLPEDAHEKLVETAGFEPLDVKLYKMHQAGVQAAANVDMLNINDYRDIYLNPDFTIDEDMDIEEINEVLRLQDEYIAQIKAKKDKEQNDDVNLSEAEKAKFSRYFRAHMDEFRNELNSAGASKSQEAEQAHAE